MTEAARLRTALNSETKRLIDLAGLSNGALAAKSPCGEWSAAEVLHHVAVTPLLIAQNLSDYFGLSQDTSSPPDDSKQRLVIGGERLANALTALGNHDLDTEMPGPFGPLLGRSAMSLALTEITLHRCDIELAIGKIPTIPHDYAQAVLTTLVDWLLLLSSGGTPSPTGLRLVIDADRLAPQTIEHSDTVWARVPSDERDNTRVYGKPSEIILFLSGRLTAEEANVGSTDPDTVKTLKQYLPGP